MIPDAEVSATPADRAALHPSRGLFWLLRLSCACEFIGHGAFGIITKKEWLPYFAVVGIHQHVAYALMPVIGGSDVTLGLLAVLRPMRLTVLYMACWVRLVSDERQTVVGGPGTHLQLPGSGTPAHGDAWQGNQGLRTRGESNPCTSRSWSTHVPGRTPAAGVTPSIR